MTIVTKEDERVYNHLMDLCENDEEMIFTNIFSQPMISIFSEFI